MSYDTSTLDRFCWEGFCYARDLLKAVEAIAAEIEKIRNASSGANAVPAGNPLPPVRRALNLIEQRQHEFWRLVAAIGETREETEDDLGVGPQPIEPTYWLRVGTLVSRIKDARAWVRAILAGYAMHGGFGDWVMREETPPGFLADIQRELDEWSREEPVATWLIQSVMSIEAAPQRQLRTVEVVAASELAEWQSTGTDQDDDSPGDEGDTDSQATDDGEGVDRHSIGQLVYEMRIGGHTWPEVKEAVEGRGVTRSESTLGRWMEQYCDHVDFLPPRGKPGARKKRGKAPE